MSEVCLRGVAIRLVKFTNEQHDWAVFEIGRVSGSERRTFEPAFENLYREDMERVGDDPTNGELQWKKAADYQSRYTVRVCLFVKNTNIDSDPFGKTYDEADVTIEYHNGNVRPSLKKIISRGREGYHDGVSWFADNPVNWDAPEPLEKTFNITCAAIRLIEWIGDYAVCEIGRLSDEDVENLKKAFEGKDRYTLPTTYDPLKGKVEIETPIDGEEISWKTARACFYIGSGVRERSTFKVGDIRNDSRIEIWYTPANIRPVIDGISGEPIHKEELASCWFVAHPTAWDEKYNASHLDIPKKEEPMIISEGFSSVAIKIEEMLGGDWWRVKIGRLASYEKQRLENLHTYITPTSSLPYGDKTNGEVTFGNPHGAEFYEAELCLRIREDSGMGNVREGMIFDSVAFDLVWIPNPFEPRLVLQNFEPKPTYGIKNEHWFEEAEEEDDEEMEEYLEDDDDEEEEEDGPIEHEFRNVAVKVLSKSPNLRYYILELGRLTGMEVERLEKMAGCSGRFHCSEDREWDVTNGTVISTYIDELGFRAARICVYDYGFKMPAVETVMDSANITLRAFEGNIRMSLMHITPNTSSHNMGSKDWFSKVGKWGHEDDNATFVHLGNVALRIKKVLDTDDSGRYVIAEIGRLTPDEVSMLRDIFKLSIPGGIEEGLDMTNGDVIVENATFLDDAALRARFFTATVCMYISNEGLLERLQREKSFDALDDITIKMQGGCCHFIRPELVAVHEYREGETPRNEKSNHWFDQKDFGTKPLTIRLNNVYLKACSHTHGEKSTVVLGLRTCCNFQQAKEGIEAALRSRKIHDELRWDEYGKEIAIKVEEGMAEALCNVAISKDSGLCLTLIFDEAHRDWRVTINGVMGGYQGGYVYSVGGRRSGKTAAMRAAMNSAYGLAIPGGTNMDDISDDAMRYCLHDVAIQTESMWRRKSFEEETMKVRMPEITNIEFRDPATIVFWSDGTKTVVRCQNGEKYDPEKGMAMAICRKVYGNERDYYHLFLHWMKKARKAEPPKKDEKPAAKKPKTAPKKKGGKK